MKLVGAFTREKRAKGVFSEGAFIATQAQTKRSVIELDLTGGNVDRLRAGRHGRAALSAGAVRRLRGSARGRFRTRGNHSAATVRGTKWLTEDFCDTTAITTQEGPVDVSLASAELELGPGQEFVAYCDPPLDTGLMPNDCLAALNDPSNGFFAVGLGTRDAFRRVHAVRLRRRTASLTYATSSHCRSRRRATTSGSRSVGCAPRRVTERARPWSSGTTRPSSSAGCSCQVPNPYAPGTGLLPGDLSTISAAVSAADALHRPRRLDEAGLADVVLQLLAPDGVADDRLELLVARAGAQRLAQVGLVQREEAGAQLALGRQPDRGCSPSRTARTPG